MLFTISAKFFWRLMGLAKKIIVKSISAKDANEICKKIHYSGKVVPNSQLHLGVFLDGKCHGVMQFGPSMRKDLTINLVKDTKWNGFIELNRMAFSDFLPKNSESRALSIAHNIIKKNYPHIEWIVSFADACQCGDGTIYRASGYLLTQIKKNTTMFKNTKTGETKQQMQFFHQMIKKGDDWKPIAGYMLRYIYFLNVDARKRIATDVIDYKNIKAMGVNMYKGMRASSVESGTSSYQGEGNGESPIDALQLKESLHENN